MGTPPRREGPATGTTSRILSWVPGIGVAAGYRREWLTGDLAAGLLLTALLVPQGMAYAALAGLSPVLGLYATMVPLVAYALFGPSRILVLGPDSAVAPVVAASIIPLAGSDAGERAALAAALAVLVGVVMIIGSAAGLGFVADLLSMPVRLGYLAGIAVTVIVSQATALLGIPTDGSGFRGHLVDLVTGVGDIDPVAAAIGVGVVVVATVLPGRLRMMGTLIGAAGATVLVAVLGLSDDIRTVGELPGGLPAFSVPDLGAGAIADLGAAAVAIALVAFADTTVLSRAYATRLDVEVDQNRELFALGAANVATGLFQGFPISSSSSRTPVAEATGARTQLTGLVAAVALGVVLTVGTGIVKDLPDAALAAIILVAVARLIEVSALRRLARVHREDFALALLTFSGVLLVGVLPGVGIAVGLSLFAFLWRVWHPHDAVLGRVSGMKGYHDVGRHPEGLQVPGLVLFRFDAPLFFANSGLFRERALRAVRAADPPAVRFVLTAEPVTDLDATAADAVEGLLDDLEALGVEVAMAEVKGPVKDLMRRFGIIDRVGEDRIHATIGLAVRDYVADHGVDWTDWEEGPPPVTA